MNKDDNMQVYISVTDEEGAVFIVDTSNLEGHNLAQHLMHAMARLTHAFGPELQKEIRDFTVTVENLTAVWKHFIQGFQESQAKSPDADTDVDEDTMDDLASALNGDTVTAVAPVEIISRGTDDVGNLTFTGTVPREMIGVITQPVTAMSIGLDVETDVEVPVIDEVSRLNKDREMMHGEDLDLDAKNPLEVRPLLGPGAVE